MSPRLTFGVEFEFSLATLASDVNDPNPEGNRPVLGLRDPYLKEQILETRLDESHDREMKKAIAAKLREAGLPTVVTLDPDEDINNTYPWTNGAWVVTTDSSVHGPAGNGYDWWAIEINSPPYIFCREALDAVLLVCRVLTSNFRVHVNESCGLHVHVGNGNDNFSFDTVQKLMAFLWCFEPVIDTLHPTHRHNGDYCRSLRTSSVFARMRRDPEITNVGILVRILQEAHGGREKLLRRMGDVLSTSYREAYHTTNLRPSLISGTEPDTKVTLEFRQHEGTLAGDRTINWVKTVVGFFELADDCDQFFMAGLVMEHADMEDRGEKLYEIEDLLRDIGLDVKL